MNRRILASGISGRQLIDGMVGEVVAALKALDLYEGTAIVFTADHGDMAGSHGYKGKGCPGRKSVECGECEPKCPQGIPIRERLQETAEALGGA